MENTETKTDIALLPPADRALIVMNSTKTEEHLKELVEKSTSITDVQDKAGREQAHTAGMELKRARTTIEKTGKIARDDATAFSKAVIAEEKRLIGIVDAEEKRVLGLRDAYDTRIERERAEKEAAEKARKDAIIAKIHGILNLPGDLKDAPANEIMNERNALAAFMPDEAVFMEFTQDAQNAILEATKTLDALYARVMAAEAAKAAIEAERAALQAEREALAKERAELEELRAMKAAQQQFLMQPAAVEPEAKPLFDEADEKMMRAMSDPIDEAPVLVSVPEEPTQQEQPEAVMQDDTAPVSWIVRSAALATAEQFEALADKVEACGVTEFAQQLRAVAYGLREGDHDAKIAEADIGLLIKADDRLLDATMNAIDTFNQDQEAA